MFCVDENWENKGFCQQTPRHIVEDEDGCKHDPIPSPKNHRTHLREARDPGFCFPSGESFIWKCNMFWKVKIQRAEKICLNHVCQENAEPEISIFITNVKYAISFACINPNSNIRFFCRFSWFLNLIDISAAHLSHLINYFL